MKWSVFQAASAQNLADNSKGGRDKARCGLNKWSRVCQYLTDCQHHYCTNFPPPRSLPGTIISPRSNWDHIGRCFPCILLGWWNGGSTRVFVCGILQVWNICNKNAKKRVKISCIPISFCQWLLTAKFPCERSKCVQPEAREAYPYTMYHTIGVLFSLAEAFILRLGHCDWLQKVVYHILYNRKWGRWVWQV